MARTAHCGGNLIKAQAVNLDSGTVHNYHRSRRCAIEIATLTQPSMAISERVYALIHSRETLTAAFANATGPDHDPDSVSPGHLAKTLYDDGHTKKHHSLHGNGHLEAFKGLFQQTGKKDVERIQVIEPTQEDLDQAAQCGDFGSRPSDLFLKVSMISHCSSEAAPYDGVCFRYTWTSWLHWTTTLGLVSYPRPFWVPGES